MTVNLTRIVKPLAWKTGVSILADGGYYTAFPTMSGKSVCVDYVASGFSRRIGYYQAIEAAQTAANADHAARVIASMDAELLGELVEALDAIVGSLEPMIVTMADGRVHVAELQEVVAARAILAKLGVTP